MDLRRPAGLIALLALLPLGGCLPGEEGVPPGTTPSDSAISDSDEQSGPATLLVENTGTAMMAIYSDGEGVRLGTVMPGETECMQIRTQNLQRLVARPMGGGESVVSPRFTPYSGGGWNWTLGTAPVPDGLSLVEAEPCA